VLLLLLALGLHFNLDKKVIAIGFIVIGYLTSAFTGLLFVIGLIPLIGPPIATLLSLPFFWILNGLGYFVSIVAIKKGHGREVLNYRVITIIFLSGVVVGYILGRVLH